MRQENKDTSRIASILVDFDGTACATDVASELCRRFVDGDWRQYDEATYTGGMSLRAAIEAQTTMLRGSRDEMLAWVLDHFAVDPTFPGLVEWAHGTGVEVAVVSDGFGFYIPSVLEAAGLGDLRVLRNELVERPSGPTLTHLYTHPSCSLCGTCKMRAVLEYQEHGPVAFCGDGQSDMFAAHVADLVFAKGRLADVCRAEGVAFLPWTTFDDVLRVVAGAEVPELTVSRPCPGLLTSAGGAASD